MSAGLAAGIPRAELFGVPVDAVTARQALARAWELLASSPPTLPALVLTPNPELIMAARSDAELLAAARAADLALPDGVGVVWAARRAGLRVPERVPGIELMGALLERAAREGRGVYLLGARPDVIEAAAERAAARFPGLRLAGAADGYFAARGQEREAVRLVAASGADLLFVGMGAPAQELFVYRHRAELGVRLAMVVGGSFDILAGATRRAPAAVRRMGLEWLWRLGREPARWRRQLALPRFAFAVLRAGRGR